MLVRQIVVRTTADQLWDALTAPDQVEAWFGSRVEWDLRPGGQARFVEGDGTVRGGEIDAVHPARHLRFRWWPGDEGTNGDEGSHGNAANDGDDGDHVGASQVSYDLEPDGDSTRLTVTEELVPPGRPATARDGAPGAGATEPTTATAAATGPAAASATAGTWTAWDSRLFGCWAATAARALALQAC